MNKPIGDSITDDTEAIKKILEDVSNKKTFAEDLKKLMITHNVVKIAATDINARIDINDYVFCRNFLFEFGKQEVDDDEI